MVGERRKLGNLKIPSRYLSRVSDKLLWGNLDQDAGPSVSNPEPPTYEANALPIQLVPLGLSGGQRENIPVSLILKTFHNYLVLEE